MALATIQDAVEDFRAGRMVIIVDDEDRENEGDLMIAAEKVTPEAVNFMATHGRGLICLAMTGQRLDDLHIPLMVADHTNTTPYGTAFCISIEAREGVSTGISVYDRARTIRTAIDPKTLPEDLARPGHIFPLRYTPGGVLVRAGHTEATVDLVRLAGFASLTGILCEIVNDDGTMKRSAELSEFARLHSLKIGSIADLIRYRLRKERSVERISDQVVSTDYGEFRLCCYQDHVNREVHMALVRGTLDAGRAFAIPTYTFVGCFLAVLVLGAYRTIVSGGHPQAVVSPPRLPAPVEVATWWLLLRAFAAGCTAMTAAPRSNPD